MSPPSETERGLFREKQAGSCGWTKGMLGDQASKCYRTVWLGPEQGNEGASWGQEGTRLHCTGCPERAGAGVKLESHH